MPNILYLSDHSPADLLKGINIPEGFEVVEKRWLDQDGVTLWAETTHDGETVYVAYFKLVLKRKS